jgi:7-cyano-7-deazaguanine synthase in queuosine biosynthesis
MKKYIKIEDLSLQKNRILVRLSCSKNIQKYLMSNTLYIEYDKNIDEVPDSILQIPAVSGIVTLAWLTGADVYVKELDAAYLDSLQRIRIAMKGMYPEFPFSEIYVDKIVLNEFNNEGYGLLFSGGLDSVTSYIRHRDKKPSLIHCFVRERQFKTNINHLINFSKEEDVTIEVIKTNIYDILHALLISTQFGIDWWPNVAHAIVLTGLSAPLAQKSDIGTLLIASSHTQEFGYPWGTDPSIANNIRWADVHVVHDGYGLSRQQKIRHVLKNYIAGPDGDKVLKVLTVEFACESSAACGKCAKCVSSDGCIKCLRNIAGLALEGIDPKLCGFNVDLETFEFIKQNFIGNNCIKSKILIRTETNILGKADQLFFWKDIQKQIPEAIEYDLYDSKKFFQWFKNFDITGYKAKNKISELPFMIVYTIGFKLYPLYCSLPLNVFRRWKNRIFGASSIIMDK